MDLRDLGTPSVDHKAIGPEPIVSSSVTRTCNVGEHVVFQSDPNETPNQRFWVAKVMNICSAPVCPSVDLPDPVDIPSSERWVKVWWYESRKEYGVYRPSFFKLSNGTKQRTISWERESYHVCKLKGGLNRTGKIKGYQKYRERLEYDIKSVCGELEGEEELNSSITDNISKEQAESLLGRTVVDVGEEGNVVELVLPDEQDIDQRIGFKVHWGIGVDDEMYYEELCKILHDDY